MMAGAADDLHPDEVFPLTAVARRRLSRLSIFSDREYLKLNPDVAQAGADGTLHALHHGRREGRELFTEAAIARAYGSAARDLRDLDPERLDGPPIPERVGRISIFVHSLSDLPARDAAYALARDLRRARVPVHLLDETADHLADHGMMVFVAPQDFFDIGRGALWWDPEILEGGFIYNTASVESVEGRRALAAILNARGILEPSAVWAHLWRASGIPTLQVAPSVVMRSRWLTPADRLHPLIMAAPAAARSEPGDPPPWPARPLDLLYFDTDTERRNTFFGHHAASFAKYSTFLYLQQGAAGRLEERMHRRAHGRIFGHLATQARITLNLAEGRFPALDRFRLVHQAMSGGSVVVSDVAFCDPALRAGTHYFHDDSKHIASLIDWLLGDADGHRAAERARQTTFDLIAAVNGDACRAARVAAFLTTTTAEGNRLR